MTAIPIDLTPISLKFRATRTLENGLLESFVVIAEDITEADEIAHYRTKHVSDKAFTIQALPHENKSN